MILTYDREAGRFRDENGNFLAMPVVMQTIEGLIRQIEREIKEETEKFKGKITTETEWLAGMSVILESGHILVASIAAGGRENMTPAMWAAVAAVLATEYRFLKRFADQYRLGAVTDQRLLSRANLYASALRITFSDLVVIQQTLFKRDPYVRLIRRALESCRGCVFWAAKGWMPYREMRRIGTLECGRYCKCYLIFRDGPPPGP